MQPAFFSETLIEGLAPDGGLAVPEELPSVSFETLEQWRSLSYPELATEVIALFATDIPRVDLERMCHSAYNTKNFIADEIVPVVQLNDQVSLLGLSEGPTLAFKDIAMQFLGQVLEYVLARTEQTLNIVGATSGDTGSAAEYALRGKENLAVFMLSPQGRMSDFQRAQMYSLTDPNIHNIAVEGVFDDCQNLVKSLSSDLDFKRQYTLGTVNSINLGRITAQVVYYFWAWLRMSDDVAHEKRAEYKISVTVPSGNFGNILSGHYAKQMGVPINKLVLATNENNVLDEFFRTGIYRPRDAANTLATSSPSMDISKASNLERFIFDLVGRDSNRLNELWEELETGGFFDLSAELQRFKTEFGFISGTSSHTDRLATIKREAEKSGTLLDPHTADGVKVARENLEPGVAMLVLETAKPAKFNETVLEATGAPADLPEHLVGLLELPQYVTEIANDEAVLREIITQKAIVKNELEDSQAKDK